jgi:hypothetical protein
MVVEPWQVKPSEPVPEAELLTRAVERVATLDHDVPLYRKVESSTPSLALTPPVFTASEDKPNPAALPLALGKTVVADHDEPSNSATPSVLAPEILPPMLRASEGVPATGARDLAVGSEPVLLHVDPLYFWQFVT